MSFIESQNQTFTYPELKQARAEFWDPVEPDETIREGSSSWVNVPSPNYLTLDELCAMDWGSELPVVPEVTEILPEAIVTESEGEKTIHLIDRDDHAPEQQLEIVNSVAKESGDHEKADSSYKTGGSLFPPRPQSPQISTSRPLDWGNPKGAAAESRQLSKQIFADEEPTGVEIKPIDGSPDSLHEAYLAPSYERPVEVDKSPQTSEQKAKKPSKFKQLLFKNRYVFEGSYYEHFGNEVPRIAIIKGGVRYVRTIEREKPVRRNRIAAVAGGIALAAAVFAAGVGTGINMKGNGNERVNQQTPTEHVRDTGPTTSIFENQVKSSPSITSEQVQAFNQLIKWVSENPDKDFVEEFQKAEQVGYFS